MHPGRARSLARHEGWGQKGVGHIKHALEGMFYVLDVRGGEEDDGTRKTRECQFRCAFHPESARMELPILACLSAKTDSHWIPPDSGRNQWRTVKTCLEERVRHSNWPHWTRTASRLHSSFAL